MSTTSVELISSLTISAELISSIYSVISLIQIINKCSWTHFLLKEVPQIRWLPSKQHKGMLITYQTLSSLGKRSLNLKSLSQINYKNQFNLPSKVSKLINQGRQQMCINSLTPKIRNQLHHSNKNHNWAHAVIVRAHTTCNRRII